MNTETERLELKLRQMAEAAYFKAAETSDPQHWLEAGLLAQQHRNALKKVPAPAQSARMPDREAIAQELNDSRDAVASIKRNRTYTETQTRNLAFYQGRVDGIEFALAALLPAAPAPGEPVAIYQCMATDDDPDCSEDIWMDVSKKTFNAMRERNDMRTRILYAAPAPHAGETSHGAEGHGYSGEFTAKECFERAFDHEKAARNGLAAGPNVSYVRTFQCCAFALRIAGQILKEKDAAAIAPIPDERGGVK